jgi:hypothetical protein
MYQLDRAPARRIRTLGIVLALALLAEVAPGHAQQPSASSPGVPAPASGTTTTAAGVSSHEDLTVLGRRHKFETAPMPGAPMGPPPDKPAPHLGRYKISGDQTQKDGYDAQTGAYIAPFGSAYTGASPVAGGLASRFQH